MRKAANKVLLNPRFFPTAANEINEVIADFIKYLEEKRKSNNTVILNDELDKWALECKCSHSYS